MLYEVGNTVLNDVTFGNNGSNDTPDAPYFSAGIDYDPVTGCGSINGTKIQAALAKLLFL